ncbi:hypothetical protein [Brasilonema sp. UFV-L1]|uniref:hypothetical protein n=1 Tax=Brasilonema sp. UFV-L1 TaxID=2234130 RepID=UPI00145F52ED|nr:hypothetical protein [Brasilonema sp. UFV-L1]
MSEEQLIDSVKEAVCSCNFMPSADDLLKLGNGQRFPGESMTDANGNYFRPTLQSTESIVENMTAEECLNNIKKMRELAEKMSMRKLHYRMEQAQQQRMRENLTNPNTRFEIMRQMLLSGRPDWVREAIAWAKSQDNIILRYAKDGDTEPSDMQLLDNMEF